MQEPGRRGWETGKGETEGEAAATIGRGGQKAGSKECRQSAAQFEDRGSPQKQRGGLLDQTSVLLMVKGTRSAASQGGEGGS